LYLTSRQSAILRIVWTAMLCILGVGSPDLDRSSGSRRSTLRATSAGVTLSKEHHRAFWICSSWDGSVVGIQAVWDV